MKKLYSILLAAFLAQIALAQQLPVDPNVRIGKLDNGLTYYIRHNNQPENQADFYIAQKVGSILEDDNQQGLAHFLEHMCFNGTKNFPRKSLIKYLESIGVKFGANLNAYTAVDETVYNISNVPVKRESIVDSCLLVLHDWSCALTLSSKEIDAERGVIHEEWRTRNNPQMRMIEAMLPEMYQQSKYAYRLPIGKMEIVDNFPAKDLRNYYKKWYRPDLQGIIVVGNIDVDQMERKIKQLFGSIKMPKNPAQREYIRIPDNKEPIIVIGKDKEQPYGVVQLMFKSDPTPINQRNSLEDYSKTYRTMIVTHMLSNRFNELLQKPNIPLLGASTQPGDFMFTKSKKVFTASAGCKGDSIQSALRMLSTELRRAVRYGFTTSEMIRAKAAYESAFDNMYAERSKTKNASYAREYVSNFLDGEPIPGIDEEYKLMKQISANTTKEQLEIELKNLITDTNIVVQIFCPDKEGIQVPTKEEIQSVLDHTEKADIKPYMDTTSDQPLMSEIPEKGSVIKKEAGKYGTTILTLSNGAMVILKPTDFEMNQIHLFGYSEGGMSLFPENTMLERKVFNQLATIGGLGDYSNTELSKLLAGKVAGVAVQVDDYNQNISGSSSVNDFETLMQLVYLNFTSPRMDEQAFEAAKQKMRANIAANAGKPSTILSDSLAKALYMNHPLIKRLKVDDVYNIDYNKIINLYKNRFANANGFTFFLVGNIDVEKIKPYIEQYIASLPSEDKEDHWKDEGFKMREGLYTNVFNQEQGTPKASVNIIVHGKCDYNEKNLILISFLKQALSTVYLEEVREKASGTYGVSVNGSMQRIPTEEAVMKIQFDTDPTKRKQLTDLVINQLDAFIANGPTDENLAKIKEFALKQYEDNLKNNGYWLSSLQEYYINHIDKVDGYRELVNSISKADLQKFAKQLVNQRNRIEVTMTDNN